LSSPTLVRPVLSNYSSHFDVLTFSLHDALPISIFILAINDVLYRYCVGWSAPYNESDIQAKDIARKLTAQKPKDAEAVKSIIQAVYDFWFGKGFAKNLSMQACEEILCLYQAQIANQKAF